MFPPSVPHCGTTEDGRMNPNFFDANCTNYHEFFTTDSNNKGSKNGERARVELLAVRATGPFCPAFA